ncbi:MAG: DUF4290 domain-containing protein [Prevotellaceae bacterium]|jgi:hypothetical protein|nr:DUF4290 domain-containing protein [Prevotellaceae bacterium]
MDYNTQRNKLALPEYGRHIQRMVEYLRAIPSREKRNEQAHAVIGVMGSLFPYLRDINDFKHKLWDHLFIIADFDLDIDSPYPKPEPVTFEGKPRRIPYTSPDTIEQKHYGRGVQDMLENIAALPEGEKRSYSIMAVANHMKKAYLAWNKESVSDDMIYRDIEKLTKGRIQISDSTRLSVGNYGYASTGSNGNGSSSSGSSSSNGQNRLRRQQQQRRRILK